MFYSSTVAKNVIFSTKFIFHSFDIWKLIASLGQPKLFTGKSISSAVINNWLLLIPGAFCVSEGEFLKFHVFVCCFGVTFWAVGNSGSDATATPFCCCFFPLDWFENCHETISEWNANFVDESFSICIGGGLTRSIGETSDKIQQHNLLETIVY